MSQVVSTASAADVDDQRTALWSGASWLERALVECCELPPKQSSSSSKPTNTGRKSSPKFQPTAKSSGDDHADSIDDNDLGWKGGSLVPGFEVRFVGLLVRYCHTPASRILAMAILERTLEQDQAEAVLQALTDANNTNNEAKPDESKTGEVENEEGVKDDSEEEQEKDEPEEEEEASENGKRRRSMRLRVRTKVLPAKRDKIKGQDTGKKQRSGKTSPTAPSGGAPTGENEVGFNEENKATRFTAFLAAGGLRILNSWLVDAMTPVYVPPSKKVATPQHTHQTRTKKAMVTTAAVKGYKPSKYGPMLLPLLELLKNIPFDKDLVMQSRINKQIRRLSKQVDALLEAHQKQKKEKQQQHKATTSSDEDGNASSNETTPSASLENLTDPSTGGLSVVQVQNALNALKSTWEEHFQRSPTACHKVKSSAPVNPFESLQRKLKERVAVLQKYEAGTVEKPTWLQISDEDQAYLEKKRQKQQKQRQQQQQQQQQQHHQAESTGATRKMSTEQRAAKEREAEREALRDRLKAAEEERKKQMERLQNQLKKRKISPTAATAATAANTSEGEAASTWKSRKNNKKMREYSVQWRDGLKTDKVRKRDLLEQVYDPPRQEEEEDEKPVERAAPEVKNPLEKKLPSIKCEEIEFCDYDDNVL